RCSAVLRHVFEQTLGIAEKRERRGARYIVFLGLIHCLVDDLGGALERSIQKCLVCFKLLPGIDRAGACCERKHQEHARDRAQKPVPPLARALGTTEHFVSANSDKTGDYLGKTEALAIAAITQIGTKHSDWMISDCAVGSEFVPQGWWKVVRRRALDDDRDHRPIRMARPEKPHLLVDSGTRRRNRRAQHEHRSRSIERGYSGGGQRGAAGEILAIPEDRAQCFWHRPEGRFAPDQIFINAVVFQRLVQPLLRCRGGCSS